mgnify:CR=1 FL=1
MSKKSEALMKTFEGVETVSVIHAAFDETPHTVALVEVSKVLAQINYEQLDAASKAMVASKGSKETTELFRARLR